MMNVRTLMCILEFDKDKYFYPLIIWGGPNQCFQLYTFHSLKYSIIKYQKYKLHNVRLYIITKNCTISSVIVGNTESNPSMKFNSSSLFLAHVAWTWWSRD